MAGVNPQQIDLEEIIKQTVAYLENLPEDFWRMGPHIWREMVTTGQPVDPERVATLSGLSADRIVALLRESQAKWDPSGTRVIGYGVNLIKTPHRYETDGRTVWVACAIDALMLPLLLGKPATIQSPCAATGNPIRGRVTPTGVEHLEPASAVVSMPVGVLHELAEVEQRGCNETNLYRDAEAASGWLAANHPNGVLLPVADAFEVARRAYPQVIPEMPVG